jgi:hypothetical protein
MAVSRLYKIAHRSLCRRPRRPQRLVEIHTADAALAYRFRLLTPCRGSAPIPQYRIGGVLQAQGNLASALGTSGEVT